MEEINLMESRKLSPQESMARLERAVNAADQRIRMRRTMSARVSITLGAGVALPLGAYMVFHYLAPGGVMHNYKAAAGAYMYWPQNFMYRPKSHQEIYRPEFYFKETASSLHTYTKKIADRRKAGDLPEGVHHPDAWH